MSSTKKFTNPVVNELKAKLKEYNDDNIENIENIESLEETYEEQLNDEKIIDINTILTPDTPNYSLTDVPDEPVIYVGSNACEIPVINVSEASNNYLKDKKIMELR